MTKSNFELGYEAALEDLAEHFWKKCEAATKEISAAHKAMQKAKTREDHAVANRDFDKAISEKISNLGIWNEVSNIRRARKAGAAA